MSRLVAALVAALLSWLGLAAPSNGAEQSPAAKAAYTYDATANGQPTNDTASKRGPPERASSSHQIAVQPAVNRWSYGVLARPDTGTTAVCYAYDGPAQLVHVAHDGDRGAEMVGGVNGAAAAPQDGQVAAKSGRAGADNVVNGVRLRAQLTGQEIAGGHAFEKHVLDLGEFPGIRTRGQFASHIEDVVMNGEMRNLGGGRTGFWRDGTVVIRNPRAPDGGTAFQPTDGYDYFLNQLH